MSSNTVITSGSAYLDIDGYASCIAYRELLNAMGAKCLRSLGRET